MPTCSMPMLHAHMLHAHAPCPQARMLLQLALGSFKSSWLWARSSRAGRCTPAGPYSRSNQGIPFENLADPSKELGNKLQAVGL
eukprot:352827-Chlamydomonas_euryale.AAC.4